jgi:hypothetical protein
LATVPVTITLTHPATGGALDEAPVDVNVVAAAVHGVLTVPITALVALVGGGYGVYLLDAGARRLVGVTPGLFSDTLVELKGAAVREGSRVEVPVS